MLLDKVGILSRLHQIHANGILKVLCITFSTICSGLACAADGPAPDATGFPSVPSLEKTSREHEAHNGYLSSLNLSGYLKNETAFRIDEPRSVTKIRNIALLNSYYPLNSQISFTFTGWAYYDLAYDLFEYDTISGREERNNDQPLVFVENLKEHKDSPVAQVRELYLDASTDNIDVRLGKQYVIWGVLEGMRITDEINPLDFRELILPDLLDYRIPLWTLKLDYYNAWGDYELLWIPDIRFHKPAPQGSEWELLQRVPNTETPDSFEFNNSEAGFKLTKDIHDTQVSLSYFYTWDDFPVVFRSSQINSGIEPEFFPTYTRINMFGMTFVRQIGAVILKGEAVYVPDKFFGLGDETDKNNDGFLDDMGERKKKHIRWGLGVDFNYRGFDLSPAVAQWVILDYDQEIIQDQYDTTVALFLRKPIPQRSSVFQMLVIGLLNLKEVYLNPELDYNITDQFIFTTGMNLFYGKKSKLGVAVDGNSVSGVNSIEQSAQFIGNFNDNDRLYMEIKYTF